MNNHCRMEFYFTRKDMQKLLDENPGAEGVIICQEIKPRKVADGDNFINVTTITAYCKSPSSNQMNFFAASKKMDGIQGCPNPPGCSPQQEV